MSNEKAVIDGVEYHFMELLPSLGDQGRCVLCADSLGGTAAELGIPVDTLYSWGGTAGGGSRDAHTPGVHDIGGRSDGSAQACEGAGKGDPAAEGGERVFGGGQRFFRRQPSEISKKRRIRFIALKTEDGAVKGKLSLYCRTLRVSWQGFYKYLANRDQPWKYQALADAMQEILVEDACNDTYGRKRMHQALLLRQTEGVHIPSERTVYRVMEEMGISQRPKYKPNSITKADREARKSNDLLKRDFGADEPLKKCVTDITELKARDGKLYVSAIFDCFDSSVLGLAMDTNMRAKLCQRTLVNAAVAYPGLRGSGMFLAICC